MMRRLGKSFVLASPSRCAVFFTLILAAAASALVPSSPGWAQPVPPCSQTSGVPCTIGGTLLVTSIDTSQGGGGGGGGGATVTFINDPLNPGVIITGNSPITAGPGETATGFLSFTLQTVSGLPTITDLSASIDATFTGDATGTVTITTPVGDVVLGRVTPGGPDTLTGEISFPGVSSTNEVITLSGSGGADGTASLFGMTYQVSISPSTFIPVVIDIKPGSDPNSFNCGAQGNLPVAILGSAGFDATTVDPSTVVLEAVADTVHALSKSLIQDVNGDGFPDIVVYFDDQGVASEIGCPLPRKAEVVVTVAGATLGGAPFTGSDALRIAR